MSIIDSINRVTKNFIFFCPGHKKLEGHYINREKASCAAKEALEQLSQDRDVIKVKYDIIAKDSAKGRESGYFNSVISEVFDQALVISFTHKPNAPSCSFYQEHVFGQNG